MNRIYLHHFCCFHGNLFICLPLIYTSILFWLYFHSSSPLSIPPRLQVLFHLLHTLTTDHNFISEHHSPCRLQPGLICQTVDHYCQQEVSDSRSLMYSHLTNVSLSSYMSGTILASSAIPDFFRQYHSSYLGTLSCPLDPQRHNATPDLLNTSQSTPSKQILHLQCSFFISQYTSHLS